MSANNSNLRQMPDRSLLRVGDSIRLLTVPACDVAQRKRELEGHAEMAGWTADTIERIIASDPVVTIDRIDEYGVPWFEVDLPGGEGMEHHWLVILDDDSWERCS